MTVITGAFTFTQELGTIMVCVEKTGGISMNLDYTFYLMQLLVYIVRSNSTLYDMLHSANEK